MKLFGFNGSTFLTICVIVSLISVGTLSHAALPSIVNVGEQFGCVGIGPISRLRYSYYGCWCGPGNSGGKTLDVLDGCCKAHDQCYIGIRRDNELSDSDISKTRYSFQCNDEKPVCEGGGLGREICECDNTLASCIKKHDHEYTSSNHVLPFTRSRRCGPSS